MEKPGREDIAAWQGSEVTKYLLSVLEENLEDIKDGWVDGDYTNEDALATVQRNASAHGTAYALRTLIDQIRGLNDED